MLSMTLFGKLGRDPELKFLGSGTAVCNFSLAVDAGYDKKNKETKTIWFRVAVFGAQAEACNKYLTKGSSVCVDVRDVKANVFKGKDGKPQTSLEVVAGKVEFGGGGGGKRKSNDADDNPADDMDDWNWDEESDEPF